MLRRNFLAASLGTMAAAIGGCTPGTFQRSGQLFTAHSAQR